MKNLKVIIPLLLFVAFGTLYAMSLQDNPEKEINKSIKKGDYKNLSKFFNETIELTLPGNEGSYSKIHAKMIIKEFFNDYHPHNFKVNNTGTVKQGTSFIIGELLTDKAVFRTYYLLKEKSGEFFIQQLKFEKQ